MLRDAARSAQRGAVLNEQLLGFARKQSLLPKAVDLNQVLALVDDLLRSTVGDTIRVETRTSSEAWPALVDPNQIELVILNLAINARDAMPSGGVLTVETRNATVGANDGPEGLPTGDYVVLSIGDTGIGMSEEVRTKAFEPFFTTKEPGKGSGLGLSMALGVARQSRGGVRIDSRLGKGTSIEVYLPRANIELSPEPTEGGPPSDDPLINGQVVLVVDDDSDVREVTGALLASLGFSVIEADGGPAAMKIIETRERVDLMLVDVAMPGMNGIEAMREARERRPHLPILLSTGYSDIAHFAAGDIDRSRIVCKPYRRDEL